MVPGSGELLLRDQDEAYSLAVPTTFSASYDSETGVISGGELATPDISFEIDITDPIPATVYVDAAFTQVGSASGTVDAMGNVVIETDLTVDLHIEVGRPTVLAADCRATPVELTLQSVVPYDPDTGQVRLEHADFTVPPAPVGNEPFPWGTCIELIGNEVNNLLAGSGHRLGMTLEGDLELPPPPGCRSEATLVLAPTGQASLGDEVAFSTEVGVHPEEDDPDCGDLPVATGFVDFMSGSKILHTMALDATGAAAWATTGLGAGHHDLTVRYRGDAEYQPARSAVTGYLVAAQPIFASTLPEFVPVQPFAGAPPTPVTPFDLTVTNPGLGFPVEGARLEVKLYRPTSNDGGGSARFEPNKVRLQHQDGAGAWHDLSLANDGGTASNQVLATELPAVGGPIDLAPGQSWTQRLRLGLHHSSETLNATTTMNPGPLYLWLALVVDGGSGPVVVADNVVTTEAPATAARPRTTTRFTATPEQRGDAVIAPNAARPFTAPVVRQGGTFMLTSPWRLGLAPDGATAFGSVWPTGTMSASIGDRPLEFRNLIAAVGQAEWAAQHPVGYTGGTGSTGHTVFRVPPDLPPGTYQVAIRYSGDALYTPTTVSRSITVAPAQGAAYECRFPGGFANHRYGVNVVAHANLPQAVPSGTTVDLDAVVSNLDLRILFDRGPAAQAALVSPNVSATFGPAGSINPVGPGQSVRAVDVLLGPNGAATATGVSLGNGTQMTDAADPAGPDQVVRLHGSTGTTVVSGAPGEVVPITIQSLTITAAGDPLFPEIAYTCTPLGDPEPVGQVTVAGTTLAVTPSAPVRQGREVTLVASVAPAGSGLVQFFDGSTEIGIVPVGPDGTATLFTASLPVGSRSLTARFVPASVIRPMTTSEPVPLEVLVQTECAATAEPGNAAVVRLVYLELLGRCPDQAGFAHWVGRLDGGTSPEVFARTISRTDEAVGRVVDDAYRTMLGRGADPAGRAFWVALLQGHGRYDRLLADLAASTEFWSLSGATDDGFITRVYERLLGRAPDQPGLDHWVARLDGGTSRRTLVVALATLDEPLRRLVDASYDVLLGRAPGTGERTAAVVRLRATGDRAGLDAALIGTQEFHSRAQSFPNPED